MFRLVKARQPFLGSALITPAFEHVIIVWGEKLNRHRWQCDALAQKRNGCSENSSDFFGYPEKLTLSYFFTITSLFGFIFRVFSNCRLALSYLLTYLVLDLPPVPLVTSRDASNPPRCC